MTEQRPLKVFLCHASADKPTVRKLHRYLKQRGIQPWLDEVDLLPGQDWQVEIPKALQASDVILVCLSKNSVDKEGYVQKEITYALDKAMEKPEGTIFIIPAKLEDCDVPNRLSRFHWVDLTHSDGYKRLIQSLDLRAKHLGPEVSQVKTDESSPRPPKPDKAKAEEKKPIQKPLSQSASSVGPIGNLSNTEASPLSTGKRDEAKPARKLDFRKFGVTGIILIVFILGILGINYAINHWPATAVTTPTSKPPTKVVTKTSQPITATFTTIPSTATSTPKPPTPTPTLGIGSTRVSEKDGMIMVFVPAGEFTMGSDNGDVDEKPVHTVYLDSFWIDQTEVTNKMYALCVNAGSCQLPSSMSSNTRKDYYGTTEFENYPVIFVDWNKAKTYCEWAERRLLTEAEWEKAARGTDVRTYPWGNGINCDLTNYNTNCFGDTTNVRSYLSGKSQYGIFDMAGNVWEWLMDWYDSDQYANSTSRNPQGPASGESRSVRGGSWASDKSDIRSANRGRYDPTNAGNYLGFRCAHSDE
jgi:formylglycine-generating enzyme required for sulfatase activity